jgi:aspartate/methionine/tyrosine aminotransferase
MASARAAVSAELARAGFAVPAQQIMLSAGTSEAYGFLFKLLCDAGDSVLVPLPSYPLLDVLAALEGVRLVPYRLAYDGAWHLDRASLAQALAGERARAIVCVQPNNPTSSALARDELDYLASFGLPVISDEVFTEYSLTGARVPSALELSERTLVFRLAGLSKSLALPQLKLAYSAIAGPPALVAEACARLEHIADAYLSAATPVQLALPGLLARGPALRAEILARLRHNLQTLQRALAGSAASVLACQAGWYAVVRVPELLDDEGWCLQLLREDQLVVQPGYFFDLQPGAYLVLSLIAPEAQFIEGAARLRARVDALVHSPST